MSEPIKPALTANEWHWHGNEIVEGIGLVADLLLHPDDPPASDASSPESLRHQIAALALYGQPFGFTREDVRWLSDGVLDLLHRVGDDAAIDGYTRRAFALAALADRIESLLPPEKPSP